MKEGIILAGGKGTRLGSTEENPKPLELVAKRPIAEWVLRQMVSKGIEHVVIAIGFGGQAVRQYFGDGRTFGCRIHYSECVEGTGAALLNAQELLEEDDPFLVANGDTYTEYDLRDANTSIGGVWIFMGDKVPAGVWVFPGLVRWNRGTPKSLEEIVAECVHSPAYVYRDRFWDIGTIDSLLLAREELRLVLPMRFAEWRVITLEMWVGKVGRDMAHHAAVMGEEIGRTLALDGKVMVIGNGGSNADAMHFATELQNGLVKGENGGGHRVMVLGAESPYLTGRVNDLEDGTHTIFAKLVETWAEEGDILVCLSTSGYSENVVQAAVKAREKKCLVGAFCRSGSNLASLMHMGYAFPEAMDTQKIQEMTMIALHCIAEAVEL